MNDLDGQTLQPAVQSVLHGEYLDLMLLAGRLSRRDVSGTDAGAAATLRAWILRQLKDCRQKLDLRHFASAPAVVVEAEIAIIAFLDNAAADTFGLSVWRLLREDLRSDYIDAGREARSVVDLGKYVYERLERLRTHPELLGREPEELLEIYDRCARLGYKFSYDGRPTEFDDVKAKIAEALVARAHQRSGAHPAPASPLEADPLLSPHLPSIGPAATRTPPLSPVVLAAMFVGFLLAGTLWLSLAFYRDRAHTDRTVAGAHRALGELFSTVKDICPAPAPRPALSRRRLRRRPQRATRPRSSR